MNTKFKAFLLAFVLCAASLHSGKAAGLAAAFHNDPWGFVEDVFVTQPELRAQTRLKTLAQFLTGAGTGVAGYFTTYRGLCALQTLTGLQGNFEVSKEIASAAIALLSGVVGYQVLGEYFQEQEEYNALARFLDAWHENRRYTPGDLVAFFDQLHVQWKGGNIDHYAMQEAPRVIKIRIYKQFPTRYQRELKNIEEKRLTIWQNIIHFDIAGIIRALGDVYETYNRVNNHDNNRNNRH